MRRCTEKSGDRNLEFASLGCLALTDEVKLPTLSQTSGWIWRLNDRFFSSIIKDHQGRGVIGSNELKLLWLYRYQFSGILAETSTCLHTHKEASDEGRNSQATSGLTGLARPIGKLFPKSDFFFLKRFLSQESYIRISFAIMSFSMYVQKAQIHTYSC